MILASAALAATLARARVLELTPANASGYIRFAIPQAIDSGPDGSYADLRISDRTGEDVPYAIDATAAIAASTPLAVSDVSFEAGRYTQAILDFGTSGRLHDAITLETAEGTYFEHVALATSDDRIHWGAVSSTAPIYRVSETSDAGNQTVFTGPTHARWVRVRILEPDRAFPIAGASSPAYAQPPSLVTLTSSSRVTHDGARTIVTLDLGVPHTGVDAIAIESTTPHFSRDVVVETPAVITDENGVRHEEWLPVASGTIARFVLGRPSLIVAAAMRTQRLRVVIENGDDRPLSGLVVTPIATQHILTFRAVAGEHYQVSWGGGLPAPHYDLGDQLAHAPWRAVGTAALAGIAPPVVAKAASAPWFERFAIPIALTLACAVLVVVIVAALQSKT